MVGSMPTLIYHFTSAGPNAAKKAGTSQIWIGRDGLPYRQEGESFKATMASRSLNLLMAARNASHHAVSKPKSQQKKFSAAFPSLRLAYQSVG
jgi:hypothetical protein